MTIRLCLSLCCLCFLLACNGRPDAEHSNRHVQRAEALYQKAIRHLPCETDRERQAVADLFRQALAADPFHGAAHNNLGAVLLEQGQLYEAALAFERARKNLPQHPDPRVNLGTALMRAGKYDDALAAFDSALEIRPQYLPAMQGKALIALRYHHEVADLDELLRRIVAQSADAQWRNWATAQLIRSDGGRE